MKIIVPMSGIGARFVAAGYKDLKPLIKVHGIPIIEHVVNLFPGEDDFIFICTSKALAQTDLGAELKRIKPSGQILEIEEHKLGPVYAVSKAFHMITDEEPVIVNYCDFFMDWDYKDFKNTITKIDCDGSIPSYKGFHPHLLHDKNLYASSKTDGNNYMIEIKEKFSYTEEKAQSPQSAGTYYFKKGSYVKKYFQKLMDEKTSLNGEYYVSLVYNLLVQDQLQVHIYDKIHHFCQWGSPEDLREYNYWSNIFEKITIQVEVNQ